MLYALLAACLGWAATACLLVRVLVRRDEAERSEARAARSVLADATRSHAEQLERLDQAHRKEVANLCQRIQAPQIAVGEHMAQYAGPDAPPIDLEDDLAMIEQRERDLERFKADLEERAEELATER